jgi:predicted RecB family nuclease
MPARTVDQGDLQAVRGIGPKVASRLKAAGIATLDELARAPITKLAAVLIDLRPRFDADRIRRERWQPQAATLTADSNRMTPLPSGSPRYRHNFTIEMQLDVVDDTIMMTKVVHVQTRDEDTWSGWDPGHVIAFIEEHAGPPGTSRVHGDDRLLRPAR